MHDGIKCPHYSTDNGHWLTCAPKDLYFSAFGYLHTKSKSKEETNWNLKERNLKRFDCTRRLPTAIHVDLSQTIGLPIIYMYMYQICCVKECPGRVSVIILSGMFWTIFWQNVTSRAKMYTNTYLLNKQNKLLVNRCTLHVHLNMWRLLENWIVQAFQ